MEQALALRALERDEEARDVLRSALLIEPSHPVALRLEEAMKQPEPLQTEHRVSIELR